ncbi:hypothetical protein KHA80_16340 [Anaerobacillus sp. HL2]|nr:hypothetical protein KHA80_16340 [Anaerobacillus sp. HL2]
MISYQLAYLKANYPTAFFASLLTSAIGQQTKVNQYILDAKSKDIVISLPSINKSYDGFTITDKKQIQFYLAAVKKCRNKSHWRNNKRKTYKREFPRYSISCSRISSKLITRRTIESLILQVILMN